jgi:hypothetical protein
LRISGDEHELQGAVCHDPVESEQRVDLALPAVKLLRDQQPIQLVVLAKRETVDAAI